MNSTDTGIGLGVYVVEPTTDAPETFRAYVTMDFCHGYEWRDDTSQEAGSERLQTR